VGPARRCTAEAALFQRPPTRPFLYSGTIAGHRRSIGVGQLMKMIVPLILLLLSTIGAAAGIVDLVRVHKAERRMELLSMGEVVRSYAIALGGNPVGHKRQQGDERTPEGRYVLDWRNPNSCCVKSLHVSYPNAADEAAARQAGVSPGGMIMIHGPVNRLRWFDWLLQMFDWTDGCIAVTEEEMLEIWDMVSDGTPIEINP
jgi:murein L,D-transpeptidase YafK